MSSSVRHKAARLAAKWWAEQDNPHSAICDRCNQDVYHGDGYLNPVGSWGSPDLLCDDCFDPSVFRASSEPVRDSTVTTRSDIVQGGLWIALICGALGYFVSPLWWVGVPIGVWAVAVAPKA